MVNVNLFNIALNYVSSIEADMGDTEVFKTSQQLYNNIQEEEVGQQTQPHCQTFVFTNGEVSNTDKIIEFVWNFQPNLCLLSRHQSTRQLSSSPRHCPMRGC